MKLQRRTENFNTFFPTESDQVDNEFDLEEFKRQQNITSGLTLIRSTTRDLKPEEMIKQFVLSFEEA